MKWKEGGCHCGKVRFKVRDNFEKIVQCNCSICTQKGFLHIIVKKDDFELLSDESHLSSYKFNTKTANHLFCNECGIASFYIPRSHPNGYSVNARCIDDLDLEEIKIVPFEGSQWEQNIEKLS